MTRKNLLATFLRRMLSALSENTLIKRFATKYPKIATFLVSRFSLKQFTGFPLTALVILFIINILTFSEIAENVIDSETIVVIDQQVTYYLFAVRNDFFSKTLYMISYLGSRTGSIVVAALVSLILIWQRRFTYLFALWLVLTGAGLSVRYGKLIFHRVRPADVGYYQEENFSFPSGHSTTAMALYALLTYFLMRNSKNSRQRVIFFTVGIIIILLVGFSRIYLGVHFLSDVLGGFVLGATWTIIGITSIEWLSYKKSLSNINQ